jgi:hypothetical protein
MKNVQHIFWSNGKNTLTLDTLLWKFPQKLLASLNCKSETGIQTRPHSYQRTWGRQDRKIRRRNIGDNKKTWLKNQNSIPIEKE